MKRLIPILFYLFISVAAFADGKHRVALLIGNQNYENGLEELKTPINNVKKIEELLKKEAQFDTIIVITDAKHDKMGEAIDDFYKLCNDAHDALIYYSGHGVITTHDNEEKMVPINVPITGGTRLISLRDIQDKIRECKCNASIIIYDACRVYNNVPKDKTKAQLNKEIKFEIDNDSTNKAKPLKGSVIYVACESGKVAYDKLHKNELYSPFTNAWIKFLESKNNAEMADVFSSIKEYVAGRTSGAQKPTSINNDIKGSFFYPYNTDALIKRPKDNSKIEDKNLSTNFYISPGFSLPAACNISLGTSIGKHWFFDASIGSPLKKTKELYIYNISTKEYIGKQSYSNINLKFRGGYMCNLTKDHKIRGGAYCGYNWSIISGTNSEQPLSGINVHSLLIGTQIEYTPIRHISLYANIEGKIPLSKQPSKNYDIIETYCPEIKDWTKPFGANFGLKFNF